MTAATPRFEYTVRSLKTRGTEDQINAFIQEDVNKMANEGWRLVSAAQSIGVEVYGSGGGSDWLRLFWEREVR